MTDNLDKAGALVSCTPFFTVVDKIGSMMSRGIPYVVDKDGNEKGHLPIYVIYSTLPNPLQTFSSFVNKLKYLKMGIRLLSNFLVRATKTSTPKAMWIIPPEIFHMEGTGKVFRQYELKNIISSVYIDWNSIRS